MFHPQTRPITTPHAFTASNANITVRKLLSQNLSQLPPSHKVPQASQLTNAVVLGRERGKKDSVHVVSPTREPSWTSWRLLAVDDSCDIVTLSLCDLKTIPWTLPRVVAQLGSLKTSFLNRMFEDILSLQSEICVIYSSQVVTSGPHRSLVPVRRTQQAHSAFFRYLRWWMILASFRLD